MLTLEACCRHCRELGLENLIESFRSEDSGNFDCDKGYALIEGCEILEAIWDTVRPYVPDVGPNRRHLRKELREVLENLGVI